MASLAFIHSFSDERDTDCQLRRPLIYVPAEEGYDDFLMSVALLCEAMAGMIRPPSGSAQVRPRRLYDEEESRY